VVGARSDRLSRLCTFLRNTDYFVNRVSVWDSAVTSSPRLEPVEISLVDHDPGDRLDRGDYWRANCSAAFAPGQPFENVALVPGSRALSLRGRVALWIHAPA
jgi:hypothetical protein